MTPTAILTGATSGLGRFVAAGLAAAGHPLVLIARDPARADATRAWLLAQTPAVTIDVIPADLSLLAETRRAAETIAARHPSIGLMIHNAGTFAARRTLTAEGHETVLAVNHLSPFLLTRSLAPALRDARVVFVGSSTSDHARIDPDNLELAHGWGLRHAYAQSKLALMIAGFEWARRLAPAATVNVVHPGLVATGLIKDRGPIGWAWSLMGKFALTPEQGAATPLRAALDPALAHTTGRYLTPAGFGSPNPRAADPALAARVWAATERLVQHA